MGSRVLDEPNKELNFICVVKEKKTNTLLLAGDSVVIQACHRYRSPDTVNTNYDLIP